MLTHIARQGQIVGKFSPDELEQALQNGTITEGDHWWRAGMKDWIRVSVQSPRLPKEKPASPPLAEPTTKEAWRVRPQHKPSKFGDEPATEKQLSLIKQAGLTDVEGLTKYDASRWLDMILDEGREELNRRQLEAYQQKEKENEEAGLGCEGHRTPSGKYREEIAYCLKAIEDEKEVTKGKIEESPDAREMYMVHLKSEIDSCKETIDSMYDLRVDYWRWLIEVALEQDEETKDDLLFFHEQTDEHIRVAKNLSDHLFSVASRLRKVPTKKRVLALLKKLDEQSQTWDDDQPDLLLTELLKEQE